MKSTYLKKLLPMLDIPGICHHCHIWLIMPAVIVSGLAFSYSFAENSVSGILIGYNQVITNHSLAKAAIVENFQEGLSSSMTFVVAYLCDTYMGRFRTVKWSTLLYILGHLILLVSFSIPVLFIVGAGLISLGKAGRKPPLRAFLTDQISLQEQNLNMDNNRVELKTTVWWGFACFLGTASSDNNRVEFKTTVWWRFACFLGAASSLVFGIFMPTLPISMGLMVAIFGFVFFDGVPFDKYTKRTEIPTLTLLNKVFRASTLKWHLHFPYMTCQISENHSDELSLSPDTAIIVESSTPEEGKLSTINQVIQINMLLKMIPMWTTFLVYSLVQATGSTFFFLQSQNLHGAVGGGYFDVSLSALLTVKDFSSFVVSSLCKLLISKLQMSEAKQKNATLIRIGAGMACSLICCITAYLVERRRLNLVHKNSDDILLSIFSMSPQFVLLGLMEGLAKDGLNDFLSYTLAKERDICGLPFNDLVLSIGNFLSIPCILIFGSWIGDTVNHSRLDLYYLMLAILNIPNLCLNLYFCTLYIEEEDPGQEIELCLISVMDGVTVH